MLDETREVMGIEVRVVHDVVTEDGEVIEDTFDWYAQDADGNVWYFGEETKEFEDGKVSTTAGSWEAGVDGAQPGILVPAEPEVGMTYRQEYYAGEAEDAAAVLSLDEKVEVPFGQVRRRAHDEGLHAARAGRPRAQVLRAGRRHGARAPDLRWKRPRRSSSSTERGLSTRLGWARTI